VAGRAALRLDLVHSTSLDRRGLLARLLDLKEYGTPLLYAEQVWNASQLVRATVDLHDPPSLLLGYTNNRGDNRRLAGHLLPRCSCGRTK